MMLTSPAGSAGPAYHPVRPFSPADADRWGVPVRLGERRVLHRGRWRWLRAMAWLVLMFFLTAAGFGLPLQAAVDVLPPGNLAVGLVGILLACASALGCYLLAVRLGERRWASELAARSALSGLVVGAMLGLLMMAVLMGAMVSTISPLSVPYRRGPGSA